MKKLITLLLLIVPTLVFAQSTEMHRFWLNLSNETAVVGQTLIGYKTGATNGFDAGIDALYFNDSATALTSLIDNAEYIIQGRSVPFVNTDIVPLGFKSDVAGSYTIALANFDGLFAENQDIFLKDNVTGTLNNLKLANYTFTTTEGVFNERFEIAYLNTMLEISIKEKPYKNIVVIAKYQQIEIYTKDITIEKVEVCDLIGRVFHKSYDVYKTPIILYNILLNNQVLVVNVYTNKGVISKKIIF